MKRLDQAKTRLSEHFTARERVRLMEQLVRNAAEQVRNAPSVDRVVLVSSDPRSAAMAEAFAIDHFDDRGLPWNDALAAAMTEAVAAPSVLVISADLPLLNTADVQAFVDLAPRPGMAIARARDAGTNALVMTPAGAAQTCFGVHGSAARHAELAEAADLPPRVVDIPSLALDLDSLDDVDALFEHVVPDELRPLLEHRRASPR